ncbi:MAG: hypothetical protein J7L07_10165 [Candidatus Odinarchaeota archaeon]|nr:hypothetical protein [Candidatus Odinarchaeota archaeon]
MSLSAEIVIEKDGKVYKQKANTLLIQFFKLLERHWAHRNVGVKNIGGNVQTAGPDDYTFELDAIEGNNNLGIVVGSGSTPVDKCSDYALENQLNLDCSAVTVNSTVCDSEKIELSCYRSFTNNTGSTVEIKEVGLYCLGYGTSYSYCIDRTVLASPITLENGKTVKIMYMLRYVA